MNGPQAIFTYSYKWKQQAARNDTWGVCTRSQDTGSILKLFNLSFEVSVPQLKEFRYASEKETSHCWPCFQFRPLTASQLFSSVPYCISYNLYKMTAFMDSCLWSSSLSGKNHREQGTSLKGRFIRRMTLAQFLVVHQLTFSFSHLPVAILRGQKGDQSNHNLCLCNSQSVNGILGILPVSACIIYFGQKSKKSVTDNIFPLIQKSWNTS